MFTGHTLDENFGVLVDENVRLSFLGVGESSLHRVEEVFALAQTLSQHKDLLLR